MYDIVSDREGNMVQGMQDTTSGERVYSKMSAHDWAEHFRVGLSAKDRFALARALLRLRDRDKAHRENCAMPSSTLRRVVEAWGFAYLTTCQQGLLRQEIEERGR